MEEKTSPNSSVTQEHWKGISQADPPPVVVIYLVQLPAALPQLLLLCPCAAGLLPTPFPTHSFLTKTCFLPFLIDVFTEVTAAGLMASPLAHGGSILETPGTGCVQHGAAPASSHKGSLCSTPHYQNLAM